VDGATPRPRLPNPAGDPSQPQPHEVTLRALYFLLRGLLDRLVYLSTGLSVILAFIGVKLILSFLHERNPAIPHVPIAVSLG
jgi:predicted tellurium resistance membrane protein TerC